LIACWRALLETTALAPSIYALGMRVTVLGSHVNIDKLDIFTRNFGGTNNINYSTCMAVGCLKSMRHISMPPSKSSLTDHAIPVDDRYVG